MKKKTVIFVLIGTLVLAFVGLIVFFACQGVLAANKRQQHFDAYRTQAVEYIKASPEIADKYGENISVKIDKTVTYSKNGERNFSDIFTQAFNPHVPDTLEEFSEDIDTLKFKAVVNGDTYEITFEKNEKGILCVSSLTSVDN